MAMVGSWELDRLDQPSKWFALSRAYLSASLRLCEDMVSGAYARSYPNAQVVMGLCHHAVELFYKGILHAATGEPPDNSHNLFDLEQKVEKHAPDVARDFVCPFGAEALPPDMDATAIKKRIGNTQDQHFRYHLDRNGKPWDGAHGFTPESFVEVVRYCGTCFEAVIQRRGAIIRARDVS